MKSSQLIIALFFVLSLSVPSGASLEEGFLNPPDSARPGVYWYFMDGNLSREGMTADLESMKRVGLGNLVFLEVNVGVPRGPVDFMSDKWQDLFAHAVREAERLGIDITLGSGPGWTGSGGPWVKPEQAMQFLLSSVTETKGPAKFDAVLPIPQQRPSPWGKMLTDFYEDVVVYAFPKSAPVITDVAEKALYQRFPYTSRAGVKEFLPAPAKFDEASAQSVISPEDIIDISKYLDSDGRLQWNVPAGDWTIVRMARRATCASTRPAPKAGLGLECDKFDTAALDHHFANYYGKLLKKVGSRRGKNGWTTVHIDSWEMGSQNWTKDFLAEFKKRRGYEAKPYLPAYSGRAVGSLEESERFLWDVRLTSQELVLENHAGHLKKLGAANGFELSIEPYDMNPTADLDLGAVADVPMCEFWSNGMGFDSSFSCIESTSIAHTMGRSIVSAEAFTAGGQERWRQYPWSMKNQGDWAFCIGVNRFVYHTFAHKPLGDEFRPGMAMGPYGVHWDRGQTWWPMVSDYHEYVSRCSHLMRQGVTVSDILYLTPEGTPHVFRAPAGALEGTGPLADKKGYGFDGCSPNILMKRAKVHRGKIEFPGGTSYSIMIMSRFETMTPKLLAKIESLVKSGATVAGSPPVKSPSLSDYPKCDDKVQKLAKKIWGSLESPEETTKRKYGRGTIYWGGVLPPAATPAHDLYPDYDETVALLKEMSISEDFTSTGPVRYGHRTTKHQEIYFVSNKSSEPIQADCTFRVAKSNPQFWNPVTGQIRELPQCKTENGLTTIPMQFVPYQSFFVIFPDKGSSKPVANAGGVNFPKTTPVTTLEGSWEVSFDPKWGGPEKVTFDALQDWTHHAERGIKYYSGVATYRKIFDLPHESGERMHLDLGTVHDIARVRLNGKDLGVVWCAPWHVDITDGVKTKGNVLEVEIANRWPNRMLGDQQAPDKDVRTVQWESGLLGGKEYKTGRYTFATTGGPNKLLSSGLLGPVTLLVDSAVGGTTAAPPKYRDGRPAPTLRMDAKDHGIVLRYGGGPGKCDRLGARDVWVFEADGTYHMHYDAAGPKGWLCSLAVSKDLVTWEKKGPILDFGKPDEDDSKSASYGVTYYDDKEWHMFYLGTPNVSGPPNLVPSFPYLTMKAKGQSPAGPWVKQKDVIPFRTKPNTYYSITASPGQVIKNGDEFLQFFSATTRKPGNPCVQRTLGIARTKDLDGPWTVHPQPMVPIEEQIENSTLHYEKAIKAWFLFTNHIGIDRGEYTDAIWVYWSKDLNKWDPANKAVVLDGQNCTWSKKCIGLPSVVQVGKRLALFYDAPEGNSTSHMRRHIGLAWLDLPLSVPRDTE